MLTVVIGWQRGDGRCQPVFTSINNNTSTCPQVVGELNPQRPLHPVQDAGREVERRGVVVLVLHKNLFIAGGKGAAEAAKAGLPTGARTWLLAAAGLGFFGRLWG